jgi:hypothetical protein
MSLLTNIKKSPADSTAGDACFTLKFEMVGMLPKAVILI